jgi:hypothetical protein
MVETVRTTASTGGLWTIVILMSLATAFLVSAPLVANSVQTRYMRRLRRMSELGVGEMTQPAATISPGTVPGQIPAQRVAGHDQAQPSRSSSGGDEASQPDQD